jgi:hypothetical protein
MGRHLTGIPRSLGAVAAAAAALAVLAASPAVAGAASVDPGSANLGSVPVGDTSAPLTITVTADCSNLLPLLPPICISGSTTDLVTINPSTTGDFAATTTCPSGLGPQLDGTSQSCPIMVRFTPTAVGARVGTLTVGGTGLGGLTPLPVVTLNGAGLASTTSSTSGADPPASPTKRRRCRRHRHHNAFSAKKRKCRRHHLLSAS